MEFIKYFHSVCPWFLWHSTREFGRLRLEDIWPRNCHQRCANIWMGLLRCCFSCIYDRFSGLLINVVHSHFKVFSEQISLFIFSPKMIESFVLCAVLDGVTIGIEESHCCMKNQWQCVCLRVQALSHARTEDSTMMATALVALAINRHPNCTWDCANDCFYIWGTYKRIYIIEKKWAWMEWGASV